MKGVIMLKLRRCLAGLILIAGAFLTSAVVAQPAPKRGEAAEVVANLYKQFAWQVLFSADQWPTLAAQPQAELEKYFDPALTALFLREQQCLASGKAEICNLEFDPIFASQDPAASNLTIKSAAADKVAVEFVYPSTKKKIRLNFKLVKTAKGWRIADIDYPNMRGMSLKKILQQP